LNTDGPMTHPVTMNQSREECLTACSDADNCTWIVYNNQGECYMKHGNVSSVSINPQASGTVSCYQSDATPTVTFDNDCYIIENMTVCPPASPSPEVPQGKVVVEQEDENYTCFTNLNTFGPVHTVTLYLLRSQCLTACTEAGINCVWFMHNNQNTCYLKFGALEKVLLDEDKWGTVSCYKPGIAHDGCYSFYGMPGCIPVTPYSAVVQFTSASYNCFTNLNTIGPMTNPVTRDQTREQCLIACTAADNCEWIVHNDQGECYMKYGKVESVLIDQEAVGTVTCYKPDATPTVTFVDGCYIIDNMTVCPPAASTIQGDTSVASRPSRDSQLAALFLAVVWLSWADRL